VPPTCPKSSIWLKDRSPTRTDQMVALLVLFSILLSLDLFRIDRCQCCVCMLLIVEVFADHREVAWKANPRDSSRRVYLLNTPTPRAAQTRPLDRTYDVVQVWYTVCQSESQRRKVIGRTYLDLAAPFRGVEGAFDVFLTPRAFFAGGGFSLASRVHNGKSASTRACLSVM
jgi:hypothetical protein